MKSAWPDWQIYIRDRCACVYCGFDGTRFLKWRQLAIDHLIPTSKGGSNENDNKVVACVRCNTIKGSVDFSGEEEKPKVLEQQLKDRIIKAVRDHLQLNSGEERKDFNQMMGELGLKPEQEQ